VDRIERLMASGPQFVPRKFPEDIETYVKRSIRQVSYRYKMRLRLKGTLDELAKKVPRWCGPLEVGEAETCILTVGAESVEMLASMLVMTCTDFEIMDAHELLPELRTIVARLAAATREQELGG
jgi:hypothetical protein